MRLTEANLALCGRQLRRLEHYHGFPTTDEGRVDLIKALATACLSEKHALATVQAWVDQNRFAPKPVELQDLAASLPDATPTFPPCLVCHDSGIDATRIQRIERWGNIYEMAAHCDCPRGRYHEAEGIARRRPRGIERRADAMQAAGPDFKTIATGEK